jgi:uncharacterized membrane protein
MFILLTIFQYFLQTITDVLDKYLITKRKIEPVNYTFYTIVTGLFLLLLWPWYYANISAGAVGLSMFSGACFSLAMYIFYLTLSEGEVSRVVPFVYGLVPLFDIFIGIVFQKNFLTITEGAALFLMIPGALLIGYKDGKIFTKHVGMKVAAAFLLSVYFALWHAASHNQPVINSLMWNRIGAAAVLLPLLAFKSLRVKIFTAEKVHKKKNTAALFLLKQVLGGGTFIFLSYLLAVGKVPIVNALQGFRYVFLFVIVLLLSKKYRHIIEEKMDKHTIRQKLFAISLIFAGTAILFF